MQRYVEWVRANPSSARNMEQFARTAAMLLSDASSLVQFQGSIAAANIVSFINSEIIASQSPASDAPSTSKLGALQVAARRTHHVLCDVQCVVELLCRRLMSFDAHSTLVVLIEALKSVLIVISRWPTVLMRLRRAKAASASLSSHGASAEAPVSSIIIPEVEIDSALASELLPAAAQQQQIGSWRDVARLVIDTLYVLRPVVYSYAAMQIRQGLHHRRHRKGRGLAAAANVTVAVSRRHAWRMWSSSLLLEILLVVATHMVESRAPPVVSQHLQEEEGAPVDASGQHEEESKESVMSRRVRGLWTYATRDPFFAVYLEDRLRRWFVRGWIPTNVPLIGGLIAFQMSTVLDMQRSSYLYTAGGINGTANTAFL